MDLDQVQWLNKIVEVLDTFLGGCVSGGRPGRLDLEIYLSSFGVELGLILAIYRHLV